MIKDDEKELWSNFMKYEPHVLIDTSLFNLNPKRLAYILDKWADRGKIQYGVSMRYVWRVNE